MPTSFIVFIVSIILIIAICCYCQLTDRILGEEDDLGWFFALTIVVAFVSLICTIFPG